MRTKGLEPPRLTTLDPKSSAATNYATCAISITKLQNISESAKRFRKKLAIKKPPVISHRRLLEGGGYLLSRFRSTIGVIRFNFSVRNGKRWSPYAIFTLISFFVAGLTQRVCAERDDPEAGETSAKPSHNRLWSVLFVFC